MYTHHNTQQTPHRIQPFKKRFFQYNRWHIPNKGPPTAPT